MDYVEIKKSLKNVIPNKKYIIESWTEKEQQSSSFVDGDSLKNPGNINYLSGQQIKKIEVDESTIRLYWR